MAGWFRDRNNSMHPLSRSESGETPFVIVDSMTGYTQGSFACPGVVLTTAHGVLPNPSRWCELMGEDRPLPPTEEYLQYINPYPMQDNRFFRAAGARFLSPHDIWQSGPNRPLSAEDYVFIRLAGEIVPTTQITPLSFDPEALQFLSETGALDLHTVRGRTRFEPDDDGFPDLNPDNLSTEFDVVAAVYDAAHIVAQRCEFTPDAALETINSSCGSEQSVSGSPLVSEIRGQMYLTAIHTRGLDTHFEQFESIGAMAIAAAMSDRICADYEAVCGQPCAQLSDLIDPPTPGVSFLDARLARISEACENNWPACQTSAYSLALEARHGTAQMPRDPVQALDLLRAAADNGSAPAHLDLALLHEAPVTDADTRARTVWQGIAEARQRTVLDLRALFTLTAAITPAPEIAADHHFAALEGGLNTMLTRSPADWPELTARALQSRLAERGLYTGPLDGQIGPTTQIAMEALCQCGH
ncbi:hypothetical protein [Boseongicola sp. H5]|uniref:hypothetical protein n=1 Tax=Boseongicola sp. H5 TaxID=2763261 RepID=UPI001D0A6699|nr:hypothetical protein [Boseongicola sp. H5]